jgi:outer membrane receptor protein involved in Fe transport
MDVMDTYLPGADLQAGQGARLSRDNQGLVSGKAQGKGQSAARMGLGILIMIRGFESQNAFAHQRVESGQGADGENQGLIRVIRRFIHPGESFEEQGG